MSREKKADDIKGGAPKVASTDARGGRDGRLGRIHDRALDVTLLLADRVPLDRALDQIFRRSRDLGSAERGAITELAYTFSRVERRLDDRMQRAAKKLKRDLTILDAPVRARLRLLAYYLDQGEDLATLEARDPYAFRRAPGLFELIAKGLPDPARRAPSVRLGIEHALSDAVAERMIEAFGEARATEMADALLERAPFTLRVNRLKATREEAQKRLGVPSTFTPYSPDGLILEKRIALHDLAMFEEGWIEPQDEGSQLIALAVGAQPGEIIYDACAGAGGKTLAMAAQMKGHGRLLAFDRDEGKLSELKKRGRRAGLTNHETKTLDFVSIAPDLVGKADRVLVDAPCTGTGTFRRHPDSRWHVTETHLRELPERQTTLLLRAIDAVRPGGLVVYATCSVLREENEAVVADVLARDKRLEPADLAETLGAELARTLGATHQLRFGPGPGPRDPDGFYVAALRRVGG